MQSRSKDAGLSSITFAGEGLRLIRLALVPRTPVGLSTDRGHHLLIDMQHASVHHLELGMAGSVMLTMQEMAVRDAQDKELPLLSASVQTLQITPARRNLLFEQPEQLPSELILDVPRPLEFRGRLELLLALVPRLKLSAPDVTREDRGRRVSAAQKLWIEPLLIPQDTPKQNIFLQVTDQDVFTLQSVTLTAKGLECELTGYTTTIMVGKATPLTNVVPSWLEYIGKIL